MRNYVASAVLAELEQLQDIDDAAAGLPRRSTPIGRGRHVVPDLTTGRGYSVHVHEVLKHPYRDEWAYPSNAPDAKELGPDWKAAGEQPPGLEMLNGAD